MEREGPPLETLTRRLAELPPDFLGEPRIGAAGTVHVAAVVQDLLTDLSRPAAPARLKAFEGDDPQRDRGRLSVALALCWLLADGWFRDARPAPDDVLRLLEGLPAELGGRFPVGQLVKDPERREEIARLALARLGFRPAGETRAQAEDRLSSISSAERERVLAASRAAEERAREIRQALLRKAAEQSADKWSRE